MITKAPSWLGFPLAAALVLPIPGLSAQEQGPSDSRPAIVERAGAAGGQTGSPLRYQDRLIGDEPGSGFVSPADESVAPEPEGFRSTLVEARLRDRDSSSGLQQGSIGFRALHRRETLNYGELLVEASGNRESGGFGGAGSPDQSGRISLQQIDMPLDAGWRWSNSLGMLRTRAPGVLGGGIRFVLPAATLNGGASSLASDQAQFVAEVGELARLDGFDGYGLSRTGGHASALGVGWAGSPRLRFAAQAISVVDAPYAGSYAGWTLALAGRSEDGDHRWRAQTVGNSGNRAGGWFETDHRSGFAHWRGVVWRIDPNLYWYGVLLSAGQRGAALAYDHVDASDYWGASVELDNQSSLRTGFGPSRMLRFGLNGGHRIDLRHSIGAALQWRRLGAPDGSLGLSAQAYQSLVLFLARSIGGERERWQYSASRARSDQSSTVHEISWTRDLRIGSDRILGLAAGIGSERSGSGQRWRPSAGISYSGPLYRNSRLELWLRHARSSDAYQNDYTSSAAVQVAMPLDEHWQLALSAQFNAQVSRLESGTIPLFGQGEIRSRDRSLWLTLRYAQAGGIPLLLGQPGQGSGAGSVEGMVFEDLNGDGQRQANERAVAGVRVQLDRTISTVTGPDGRYEFPLVRSGRHRIELDPSSVRLPWAPALEDGWRIELAPRDQTRRDLPLNRLGE